MNISLEQPVADSIRSRASLFKETLRSRDMWMGYCLIVIVALFVRESYITWNVEDWANKAIKIRIGSVLTWCILVGGVILAIHDFRTAKQFGRLVRSAITRGQPISAFCSFTESSLTRGLTEVWSRSDSWEYVLGITFTNTHLVFDLGHREVKVNRVFLTAEQIEELKAFFSQHRQVVPPATFFGWRIKSAGEITFGEVIGPQ